MNLLKLKDEQLISKITQDFQKAENHRLNYEEKWKNNYRLYRSLVKEKREGRANLFIPYIFPIVEQLKARTQQALFKKLPYVGFAGVEPTDVDGAEIMESLVGFQMDTKINLPYKTNTAFTSIFVYGFCVARYEWKYEEKKVKSRQPITLPLMGREIQIGEEEVEELITSYDDPDIEYIPVDDFYWDPEGWDSKTCKYYCTRVFKDTDYLKQKEKEGKYKLPDDVENEMFGEELATNFREDVTGISILDNGDRKKTHEIISYYTDEHHIVMLNRKYIILKEENPLYSKEKPFKIGKAIPLEKELPGLSIVEVLADLQEELNTTRNQRIDNVSLILNKVWKKRRSADIDEADLVSQPGAIIEMDDIRNDLEPLDYPDVTQSAYREEEIIKQDMQYISGVSEYARGATPQRKETATTVTTIQEAANLLFNYTIGIIERTLLLPLGDALKKLNQQYLDKPKIIRLLGEAGYEYKEVTPEEIVGNFDVVSKSPSLEAEANKEVKRGQLLEMLDIFTSNPLTQQHINVVELMKEIMSQYDIKDYSKFIIEQQPIEQQSIIPDQMPTQEEALMEMSEDNGM